MGPEVTVGTMIGRFRTPSPAEAKRQPSHVVIGHCSLLALLEPRSTKFTLVGGLLGGLGLGLPANYLRAYLNLDSRTLPWQAGRMTE